ncbi:MAG: DPP IV N-terminal domain-containing protein [Bacteroidaceae bacterium]|nr:DPP IV N-terminal domain-containing protein [Bacteroidaceae bacterium]
MKKYLLIAWVILLSCSICQAQDGPLKLKDAVRNAYAAQHVYGVRSMNDGEHYTQLSSDNRKVVVSSFKTGKEVATLFDVNDIKKGPKLHYISDYILSPDERNILIQTQTEYIYRRSFTAVYYIYNIANKTLEPLSDGGPQQAAKFSPDGNVVGFVRDGNLFLVKLLYGNAETQVTKDGKFNEVINGVPDWVNEEEFATNCSFDFSADSKMLAWVRYDESQVPIYRMQMWKGAAPAKAENDEYPGEYAYKYPVAGATNSKVTVHSFDIKNRVTRTLKVPLDEDGYVPRIHFTDDPEKLAVVTLNRHQNQMDIYMVNPRSTEAKLAVRETNDKYIRETAYGSLKFYKGHFGYLSDRSGYQHLYWYTLNGKLVKQVTSGDFEVTDFYGYDATSGQFYYAAHGTSPLRKEVYSTTGTGKPRLLTSQVGTNDATFSTTMKYFLNVYSSAQQPPITTLRNASGKVLATLLDNADLKKKADSTLGQKEFFTFTTSEGVTLNGWMIKPRDFDPAKKYPVIMYQYSGPGSQEVKDAWNMGFFSGGAFESYMAEQGYVYVCVDGRGTGGRGAEFEKCTYLNLGLLESRDQVETALYLGTLPYVDKTRIGIWGWSFGGFNTLMAMSEGRPVFCCGVAIAAPSSWRYYDTVYTERYMRTPQENSTGYDRSPINQAKNLSGHLLLIHGTADDNVHVRNAHEMSEALVQADKQFDMHIYTNRNHSIYGGNTRYHLFTRMCNFFDQHLKP